MIEFVSKIIPHTLTKVQIAVIAVHVAGKPLTINEIYEIGLRFGLHDKVSRDPLGKTDDITLRGSFRGRINNALSEPNQAIRSFGQNPIRIGNTDFADVELMRIFGADRWETLENALNRDEPVVQAPEITSKRMEIGEVDFFIASALNGAPAGVMIREFITNGIEAPDPDSAAEMKAKDKEYVRRIRLEAVQYGGGRKLSIRNNGRGLDPYELDAMMSLAKSGSDKTMGHEGRENRGEGAKLASARFNQDGVVCQSRKNGGPVHECAFFYDKQAKRYSRMANHEGSPVWEVDTTAFPDIEFPQEDFVRVILLGNSPGQDTVSNPYESRPDKNTVPYEVWNRWYHYPAVKSGARLVVESSPAVNNRGGKDYRHAIPQGELHKRFPKDFTIDSVMLADGVRIEYVDVTKRDTYAGTIYSWLTTGENGSRMALVWQNELYDVHTPSKWKLEAVHYGLGPIAARVGVFIHLPDDYEMGKDDRFRLDIEAKGRRITCQDFRDEVFEKRPARLRKEVEDIYRPKNSYSDVEKYLKDLAASMQPQAASTSGSNHVRSPNFTPKPPSTNPSANRPSGHTPFKPQGKSANTGKPLVAPTIIWVTKAEEPNLAGRAAFFDRSSNKLFLNSKYSAIDVVGRDVYSGILPGRVTLTDAGKQALGDLVRFEIERALSRAIGEIVVRGMAKEGSDGWTTEQVNRTLSAEALTIPAEAIKANDIIEIAKKLPAYAHATQQIKVTTRTSVASLRPVTPAAPQGSSQTSMF